MIAAPACLLGAPAHNPERALARGARCAYRPIMDPRLRGELERACASLPLFPLPGVVFIPSTLLPLHVFEPRYRKLVKDCLDGSAIFAVPLLREGWQSDYEGRPPVHEVAGVGRIVRSQALPDGRFNLLVLGLGRVHIDEEPPTDEPYRLVRAHVLDDRVPAGADERLRLTLDQIRLVASQIMTAQPVLASDLGRVLASADGPAQLVDMLAHLTLREPEDRQSYMEIDDLIARAEVVLGGLVGLLSLEQGIEA